MQYKKILKNLNRNHELAILFTLLFGLLLSIAAIFLGTADASIVWLNYAFILSRVVSGLVAGASYIGRAIDLATGEKTLADAIESLSLRLKGYSSHINKIAASNIAYYERAGSHLGLLTAIVLCTACFIFIPGFISIIPLAPILSTGLVAVLIYLVNIGVFIGIFSRLGRMLDRFSHPATTKEGKTPTWRNRFRRLNRNYELAIILTAVLGFALSLILLSTIGVGPLLGIAALAPGLPTVLASLFFTISFTSIMVSGASYLGRALDYVFKKRTLLHLLGKVWADITASPLSPLLADKKHKLDKNRPKYYEKAANLAGIGIALAVFAALLVFGGIPATITALSAGIIVYPALLLVCIGVFAGLCSRIGRTLDRACKADADATELKKMPSTQPASERRTDDHSPECASAQGVSFLRGHTTTTIQTSTQYNQLLGSTN